MESEKPCLVLIAEDAASSEESAETVLTHEGYVSASFRDSYRALEYLSINADRVDLIIIDADLPGVGAIETARKAVAMNPHVSIILLYSQPEKDPQPQSPPNIRFALQKPVSEGDLLRAVGTVIKECGLLPERRRYP